MHLHRASLLLSLIFPLLGSSWLHIKDKWRTGKFSTIKFPTKGHIQHLTVKNGGRLTSFYNVRSRDVIALIDGKLSVPWKEISHFVVDLDIEEYEDTVHHVVAYYDIRANTHVVRASWLDAWGGGFLLVSKSPVKRCCLTHTSCLVVTADGTVHDFEVGADDSSSVSTRHYLGHHIYLAEYYYPYLYMVDASRRIHLYCHEEERFTRDIGPPMDSQVRHLHSHPTHSGKGAHVVTALHNGTVISFILPETEQETKPATATPLGFTAGTIAGTTAKTILRIYADFYKSVALLDDGSLSVHDSATGEFWYRLPRICNPSFVTRMFVSHRIIVTDGTDGIIVHDINPSNASAMKRMDFSASQHVESAVAVTKTTSASIFLEALMKTPPIHGGGGGGGAGETNNTNNIKGNDRS